MSDTKSQPLTEAQRSIFDSIPALPAPTFSIQDRIDAATELAKLRADNERLRKESAQLKVERDAAQGELAARELDVEALTVVTRALTKEKDQAVAACASMLKVVECAGSHDHSDGDEADCVLCQAVNSIIDKPNPGQPLLDLLHEARWIIEFIKRAESHEITETEQEEFLKRLDKWNEAAKKECAE